MDVVEVVEVVEVVDVVDGISEVVVEVMEVVEVVGGSEVLLVEASELVVSFTEDACRTARWTTLPERTMEKWSAFPKAAVKET